MDYRQCTPLERESNHVPDPLCVSVIGENLFTTRESGSFPQVL